MPIKLIVSFRLGFPNQNINKNLLREMHFSAEMHKYPQEQCTI